ncbi:MAG: hypothetical protein Q4C70_12750 [Planctomycetia bacterium]|nr:hypothetical protein [Planctomycetia bacterium]
MHSVRQFILGPEQEFLAISRGIERMDLAEIRNWSAGSDDLISSAPLACSWNFHPLPSGKFCLSRTSRLALLFPKENSHQVFTHGILIPPEFLKDYANNAISLCHHLEKLGLWRAGLEVMRQLWDGETGGRTHSEPISNAEIMPVLRTLTMDGGAEAVRLETLNAFARTTGIRRFSAILDQILGNFTTVLTGNAVPEMMMEALLDVLPVGCRTDFSFSTGLKFSPKRLFRVVFVGNSASEQDNVRYRYNLPMISTTSVSLLQDELLPSLKNRWAMFIATLFEQNLEHAWGEIALLDETFSPADLPRRARFWFRKLGLETIYQKIRESRKNNRWNNQESYGIYQTHVSGKRDALNVVSSLLHENLTSENGKSENVRDSGISRVFSEKIEKTGQNSENGSKLRETVSPRAVSYYLATLSEAMHGNPLAQNHLKNVFQEITASVPASARDEASETLLLAGVRNWNEEHNTARNRSWRQVEEMVDTLSTMLNLLEDERTEMR